MQAQIPELEQSDILKNEPLAKYTNTNTGGPADLLAFPTSIAEIAKLVKYAVSNGMPVTVIGNASNLIVRDGGLRGLVLILTRMNNINTKGTEIVADAGATIIDVTKVASNNSLAGLEFAAGIPGSVGGAVFMNAGAYGGETATMVKSALVVDRQGKMQTLSNQALDFGYRHSSVQDSGSVIVQATFSLAPGNHDKIQAEMDELNDRRERRQPLSWPSCGSVFKRPVGYFAGKLIHDAGLQGFSIGGVQVSIKHAGFIVNTGGGTASDYLAVIHHVQEVVRKEFGVQLATEVQIIGEK